MRRIFHHTINRQHLHIASRAVGGLGAGVVRMHRTRVFGALILLGRVFINGAGAGENQEA